MVVRKILEALFLGTLAYGLYSVGVKMVEEVKRREELAAYTEEELPVIMREQEETLDIIHEGTPTVELLTQDTRAGTYHSRQDTITVTLDFFVSSFDDKEKAKEVMRLTLQHELGHFYTDQRAELLISEDWPDYSAYEKLLREDFQYKLEFLASLWESRKPDLQPLLQFRIRNENFFTEFYLKKMLSEGVAEFFGHQSRGEENSLESIVPESIVAIRMLRRGALSEEETYLYSGGYHLIKPLMDEFGVQPVVDYIVTHEPEVTGKLREDVLRYQRQVQEELRKGKVIESEN